MSASNEYAQAAADMRSRIAELWDALLDGRITEDEAIAGVLATRREAEGVHAVAAAEVVVLEAVICGQAQRIAELEKPLDG